SAPQAGPLNSLPSSDDFHAVSCKADPTKTRHSPMRPSAVTSLRTVIMLRLLIRSRAIHPALAGLVIGFEAAVYAGGFDLPWWLDVLGRLDVCRPLRRALRGPGLRVDSGPSGA